jgi:hypothetical protein
MATPNLNITHIVTAQAQKEVTANEAFDALDGALCGQLSVDFTAGNVTLSDAQFRGAIAFRAANLSVARDLTVPAIKRLFVANNKDGTNTLTAKRGATSVVVAAGKAALLYTDGTTDGLFAAAADTGTSSGVPTSRTITAGSGLSGGGDLSADRTISLAAQPYDIASFYPGVPGTSQLLLRFTATRSVTLPASLTGSYASAGAAATAQTDIDVQVNGVSKGTVRFAAAATTASFIFSSPVTLAAADALTLIAPASADATLANIAITLAGTR